jgi:hypothetical protein
MVDHRSADPAPSGGFGGVHGLQFGVVCIERLERADAEEHAVVAEAEERDGGIEESIHVKRMTVLGRAVRVGERQVALEQQADVLGSRVVRRDLTLRRMEV